MRRQLRPLLEGIPDDKTSTIILFATTLAAMCIVPHEQFVFTSPCDVLVIALTSERATMCLQNRMSSSPSLKVYLCECLWRY